MEVANHLNTQCITHNGGMTGNAKLTVRASNPLAQPRLPRRLSPAKQEVVTDLAIHSSSGITSSSLKQLPYPRAFQQFQLCQGVVISANDEPECFWCLLGLWEGRLPLVSVSCQLLLLHVLLMLGMVQLTFPEWMLGAFCWLLADAPVCAIPVAATVIGLTHTLGKTSSRRMKVYEAVDKCKPQSKRVGK